MNNMTLFCKLSLTCYHKNEIMNLFDLSPTLFFYNQLAFNQAYQYQQIMFVGVDLYWSFVRNAPYVYKNPVK